MTTINELPTVNFDSYPGYDEFKFLHTTYSDEFKKRSSISCQSGIVDTGYDPSSAPFSSGRPLLVTISPVNPLTIDIAAGYAITPSNLLIDINAVVPSVPLPSIASGKTYVVAVEYTLVASPQQRVNRFGDLTEVRLERPSNIPPGGGASTLINAITVADINDFNNVGLFDNERKQNIVVIAIVTVQSDPTTSQLYLSIDLTRNSYAFNRPWFTVRDVEHRSKIGSGLITENNPHGTDLQDLSSAGLTLYQQLKPRGGILAKDVSYYGYAGKICSEEITLSRWESDIKGTVTTPTGQPPLAGRYYVRLSKLPVRTGSLYFVGKPWEPIPYEWVEGTRTIILGALENPTLYEGSLIIEYFTVDALEINAESPTQGMQTVQVKSPANAQEFIISSGLAVSELAQDTLSLPSLLGPIKKGYQIICDGRGSLLLNPQPILASVKVVDLTGTTQTVNQATYNAAAVPLILGLTRAIERTTINTTTTFDLDLKVQIIGVDGNGTSRVEILTFKGSQWKDQSTTLNQEEPLQVLRSFYKYQLVNSIALANTLSEPHNAGPEATLSLWADTLSGNGNQEFASVASLFWTGTTGVNVKDERCIATSFDKLDQKKSRFATENPDANLASVQELFSAILTPPLTDPTTPARRLMLELDDDRMWSETWKDFSTSWASGVINLVNISFVTMGQTIRIASNKFLKIVSSGADPSKGEVNYSQSVDIFKNNIILTINDPAWDSTWWASLGSGTYPPILLSRENAYPEGFVVNKRQKILFGAGFTTGSFTSTINGVVVGPVASTGDHNTTILAIRDAITASRPLTGVTAELVLSSNPLDPYTVLVLNGSPNGDSVDVTSMSAPVSVDLLSSPEAFTVVQPYGGILPTPHLPQRYPSSLTPWVYLSRPFLWAGVGLEAVIKILNDDPNYIGNLDAIEIAPAKVIFARVGIGATADPTIGQFLVDTSSLTNTFNNLVATVNHPVFASGIYAAVEGNEVKLRSAGMAATTLRVLSSAVSNAWELTADVNGVTQYLPTGSGRSSAFLKSLHPLDVAEWRFVTVENKDLGWSNWLPLTAISPTAYILTAPAAKSLYQIQLKLVSREVNNFSLYDFVPEVSGATLEALETRMDAVEAELSDARGNLSSLSLRLFDIVDEDGIRIQDPELIAAHGSVLAPEASSLKSRFDVIESTFYLNSLQTYNVGMPAQLISGLIDTNGNSKFILESNPKVLVGGNSTFPLLCQLNGWMYRYTRQVEIDFTGQPAATYYVYLEAASSFGKEMTTGSAVITSGSNTITDLSANFVTSGVEIGQLLRFSSILVGTEPLVMKITNVTATILTLSGSLPETLALPTPYAVYNPREGLISYTTTKTSSSTRLYLGEVIWTGSAVSALNYRYLNKYTSPLVSVSASGGSYTQTFDHNLGVIPSSFTLYYYYSLSDDPKVLHIGDEAVVKTTKYTMTVRNRYANLVARSFDGTAHDAGYLQLVI